MVVFIDDTTGNPIDTTFTDDQGFYQIDILEDLYDIYFSHQGYAGHGIHNLDIIAPITLEDVTLPELPPGEHISGVLHDTLEAGTYLVEADLLVGPEDTLAIEPGAVFLFIARHDLEIFGYMHAVGTASDSICFMGASPTVPWGSIIFRQGADSTSILSYCLVTGAGGSGLNTYWTDITISHCTFTQNTANWGGGIYASYCNPIITDCIFTNNSAKHNGGGIYCTRSAATITDCMVTGNVCSFFWGSGRGGAGITANHSSSPTITGCTVSNNTSYRNGGGISINDDSHPLITDCIITNNRADSLGGGICLTGNCDSIITRCTIDSNSAPRGGGIWMGYNINYDIDSCDIRANSADTLGGGIFVENSAPYLSRCTIAYNSAPDTGGGIYSHHNNMNIVHCTVSHNGAPVGGNAFFTADSLDTLSSDTLINSIFAFATSGEGIYIDTAVYDIEISYCDIYGNAGGDLEGTIPDSIGLIEITNNNGDPCDYFYNIFLDPLFDNAPAWVFHLQEASPCIDAGDPNFPLDPDTTIADIGVHYRDRYAFIDNKSNPLLPTEFRLYQNYPNPFNATTVLNYSIRHTSRITLIVYNILGQKVETLFDGMQESGIYRATWNASNHASGIYFAQLQGTNHTNTIKMVLLK